MSPAKDERNHGCHDSNIPVGYLGKDGLNYLPASLSNFAVFLCERKIESERVLEILQIFL